MGLIPRETQNSINTALRTLFSIDKSLGRIADALEKQNEDPNGLAETKAFLKNMKGTDEDVVEDLKDASACVEYAYKVGNAYGYAEGYDNCWKGIEAKRKEI